MSTLKKGDSPVRLTLAEREINTNKEIAKVSGLSRAIITKVKKIVEKGTKDQKKKLVKGTMSINAAYKTIRRIEKKNEIKNINLVKVQLML